MSDFCKDETCTGKFREVIKDYVIELADKTYTVPNVARHVCNVCGTEMFGADALAYIDRSLFAQGWRAKKEMGIVTLATLRARFPSGVPYEHVSEK